MARVSPLNFKPISRTVTAADTSVLFYVKWDTAPGNLTNAAGTTATAATVANADASVDFQINGVNETEIGTYTGNTGSDHQVMYLDGATVQGMIDRVNGTDTGVTRWRAGLGDFRPQFVVDADSGIVVAAANAMLGAGVEGLPVYGDTSELSSVNALAVGLGTDRAIEGRGQSFPDHFQSGYTSTVAGVETAVRERTRQQERQPGHPKTQVVLTDIQTNASFATTSQMAVYDDAGNLLKAWDFGITGGTPLSSIPGSGTFSADNPAVVGPPGSPLFVEFTGTGALTGAMLSAYGYERIA